MPRRTVPLVLAGLFAASLYMAPFSAGAQQPPADPMAGLAALLMEHPPTPIKAPALKSISLGSTGSPDSDQWEQFEGMRTVRNVTQAALYPVLPPAGKANGTAVIIAPGGGFMSLSMDSEGWLVADYLAARGITCFVLKYRLDKTPAEPRAFVKHLIGVMGKAKPRMVRGDLIDTPTALLAQEDGLNAVSWVRAHAAEYGINPQRIGFTGFSAGGMTTMNVVTHYQPRSRPDFIGVIYGAGAELPVPADAPPAFIALAADDQLLGHASVPIFEDWRAAGKPVELHVYARGGHGFGMRPNTGGAENWIADYYAWMKSSGLAL
jgi:acetyl esterase/lipase